jgi:DNA mismatch repair ATPase MutS
LGQWEALASLAGLAHDNPDWPFPSVDAGAPKGVEASALGHPRLPDPVRVVNDVTVGPPGTFLFVTGSNMSGKTTLLRALGTNIVLAQAGAPVCAARLSMSPLVLATVMRVEDSLVDGVSMFMAALYELKRVVDLARRLSGRPDQTLIYLLDEVLRGTNTVERQIAVRRVLDHLLAEGAVGAISSHDVHLASTEPLAKACVPVHFRESVERDSRGPRVRFDYKIHPGVATSTNALRLLKLVGLD